MRAVSAAWGDMYRDKLREEILRTMECLRKEGLELVTTAELTRQMALEYRRRGDVRLKLHEFAAQGKVILIPGKTQSWRLP